jgi:PAS domain S-box-containing protein
MDEDIAVLKRMLERERAARKEAEKILEEKSLSLYLANEQLREINRQLEEEVRKRTKEVQSLARIPQESPEPILRISLEGLLLFCNEACKKLRQYPIVYQKEQYDIKAFCKLLSQELNEISPRKELEIQVGHSVLSLSCIFLPDEGYINMYGRDITTRKQAEKALKTTASRLTTLISNFQSGLLLEDQDRKIVLVNQLFCTYFGIPLQPEVLIGMDCAESSHQVKHLFRNPEDFIVRIDTILTERRLVLNEELELVNGTFLERDYIPIFENGEYLGHLWKYKDITERKALQFALERREEKYRGIIENMNLGLIEVDTEENICYANQSFCQATGYTPEQLLGQKAVDIFLRGMDTEMVQQVQERRTKGLSDAYELQMKNARGEEVWMLISGGPLYDDHKQYIGSIGIHLDITAHKKMEVDLREAILKAEESSHAKELFLANMSHEIRTPMNAIVGMSRLLAQTPLNAQQESFLKAISTSSENLLVIINDILDFSKIEAGKLQIEKVAFEVREVVEQVREVLAYKVEENGLQLQVRIDPKIARVLRGDPFRINQVLLNLTGNAVKFTPSGSVEIIASLKYETPTLQVVEFKVKDTGIGIGKSKLGHIFDSFTQEDNTITRKYGGTGLGLSICKRLVELMGGTIEAESEKNRGTTMCFTLGFEKGCESELEKKETPVEEARSLKGKHLLLVEDNEFNRFLATTILGNHQAIVTEAIHGKEAIDFVKAQSFDLILMDIQMPEMNGWEATHYLRNELNIQTPIIALTANAIKGEKEKCLNLGMNDYLSKPFEEEEFIERCTRWAGTIHDNTAPSPGKSLSTHREGKLYDISQLRAISRENQAFVDKMLKIFLDQMQAELPRFEEHLSNQQYAALKSLAHKVKPSIDNMGIVALQQTIRDIEALDPLHPDPAHLTEMVTYCTTTLRTVVEQIEKQEFSLT